MEQDALIFY